tara:strand:- start:17381 stop:17782 length:402 start_codon:yes stop_codon:yes gene_type:complete
MKKDINFIGIVVTVIVSFLTVYAQYKTPETTAVLFLTLAVLIFLYYWISTPLKRIRNRIKDIDNNDKAIKETKKTLSTLINRLDLKKDIDILNVRVSILEKMKDKKGQIDPQIVLLIIIVVVFIIFLRAKGII